MYIRNGLEHFLHSSNKEQVSIFEMGFGTGLNAALAMKLAFERKLNFTYTGIERDPIDWKIVEQLKIPALLQLNRELSLGFKDLHVNQSAEIVASRAGFLAKIEVVEMELFTLPSQPYDVVFYDAFGPGTQAELWDRNITDKLFLMMNPDGILTTFCAQGQFRRNLLASGFQVERLQGPPGKRQMIRALKP